MRSIEPGISRFRVLAIASPGTTVRPAPALDEALPTAYLLGRAAPNASRPAGRSAAAGPFQKMVRGTRVVAARASARSAQESSRRSLRAADRADRRRQDPGRIPADAGGTECDGADAFF